MSYTVLARKLRSQSFDEVVGQEAVVTTLRNAITQDRVHHGYLFCGTRGVGKTSMARILAKSLNCLSSDKPTVTPCGTCDACVNTARGEDVDVVEIDAASNTGVDNIRELRSNAVYRPARSRFKIYIIDEVHMLSTGAFNALLKTLEEPPSHVKFILATTEAQKVPATILSRVQRFDFKAIAPAEIAGQLSRACESEGVAAEPEALKRLARLAGGSMRDALSLLDQVMSMGGGRVSLEVVNELIPATHDEIFAELIDRLADQDAAGALDVVDRSLSQGRALDQWCGLFAGQLRDLMILRICGKESELVDVPAGLRDRIFEQAQRFDGPTYVFMIGLIDELRRSVKSGGSGRALLEAVVVRLAEAANFSSLESLMEMVKSPDAASASVSGAPRAARASERPTPAGPQRGTTAMRSPSPEAPAGRPPPAPASTAARRAPAVQASASTESAGRRITQADLKAATADPLVRETLDIFGGQIVHVQRPAGDGAAASD